MQAFLDIFDIYLLETVINGVLFGGVLALLALGLNLIFGVIDVTWICYAELIMIGMYGMYYLVSVYGVPYWVAAPMCILLVAGLGALLHFLVIAPLLSSPPINQLLATGGVLFFLQSFATVAFGIEFHNIGIQLPVLRLGGGCELWGCSGMDGSAYCPGYRRRGTSGDGTRVIDTLATFVPESVAGRARTRRHSTQPGVPSTSPGHAPRPPSAPLALTSRSPQRRRPG